MIAFRQNSLPWPPRQLEREHDTEFFSMSRPPREEESDNHLLLKVGTGDREAFSRFYDRFSTPLYSLAVRMLRDQHEAEDALQEGMTQLWRKAPTFDPGQSSAFTWTVMIFRSRLVDRLRKRASVTRTLDRATSESQTEMGIPGSDTGSEAVERRENCDLVRLAVGHLKDDQAQLLEYAFFEGCTHQEVAERTGRPLGTVKTLIRRALLELRTHLTKEGYDR